HFTAGKLCAISRGDIAIQVAFIDKRLSLLIVISSGKRVIGVSGDAASSRFFRIGEPRHFVYRLPIISGRFFVVIFQFRHHRLHTGGGPQSFFLLFLGQGSFSRSSSFSFFRSQPLFFSP